MSAVKTLNRYKLVGGPHIAADVTAEPLKAKDDSPILDKNGAPKYPVRKFEAGEIVVSADDLVKKHANKFVFAGPYGGRSEWAVPTSAAPSTPGSPPAPPPSKFVRADLEAMTVVDLRALAAEEEIDLSHAHVKAEIVNAILAAK